jgi:hypothetical protein
MVLFVILLLVLLLDLAALRSGADSRPTILDAPNRSV